MTRVQQARITAEVALGSSRAAAEAEANALRQQLLQALQKACDAELRASNLQQDRDSSAAQQQVRAGTMVVSRVLIACCTKLQTNAAAHMQVSETDLVQKMQEDLSAAETALAAERATVLSMHKAAASRESELDAQLSVAAAEVTAAQQAADERATALATAEERASTVERELEAQTTAVARLQERLRR